MRRKLAAILGSIVLIAASTSLPSATQTLAGGPPPPAGVYVFYDWRNLNPGSYPWIKGGELFTRWNLVESGEGVSNWGNYDSWINNVSSLGKGITMKVTAFDQPYDGVPGYVYAAGVPKVQVGSVYYPMWWHPTFINKYTAFISRLGQKYNGNAKISAVIIGVGDFGEGMPGYGSLDWTNFAQSWYNAGLTSDIWVNYNKRIIDAYVAAFPNKPLFYLEQSFPDGNSTALWDVTDYAAAKGVNMTFGGYMPDNDKDTHWFTPYWKYVPGTLMGRSEHAWPNINQRQTYWVALNGLRNHSHILSFYDTQNMDWGNKEAFDFANKYAGKTIQNTPGVWSALKEADPAVYRSHVGNYEFWLYQLDPAGTSVPLFNVGTAKEGMYARRTDQASGKNYLSFNVDDRYIYGGTSSVRATVTYYDSGLDSFELQYDATTNAYKSAGIVRKTNTYTWKKAVFNITDATFANREAGADLRLFGRGDGDDTFHLVEIERLSTSAAAPTVVPTSTSIPAPTSTPMAIPTSTPILVPTSTPPPTNTPVPTSTPLPTNTPAIMSQPPPTNTPDPTPTPRPLGWGRYKVHLPNIKK